MHFRCCSNLCSMCVNVAAAPVSRLFILSRFTDGSRIGRVLVEVNAAAELVTDTGNDTPSDWNSAVVVLCVYLRKQGPLRCC